MSKQVSDRPDRVGVMIWGLILIAVGGWFLLKTLGFPLPGMEGMWPIFPTLVGVGLFVGWLFTADKRTSYGMMIPATITFLIGLFFFLFTLRILPWSAMGSLWPVFPLIVGIAFFVAWVFSLFRDWGLLIPGGITGAVGIIGLAFTLAALDNRVLRWILKGWPVLLILLGLLILVGGLLGAGRRRSYESRSQEAGVAPPAGAYEPSEDETSAREFKRQQE